ncbi:rhodanese-like domain protein [Verrucomicrobiia bacterium DG1235]|nr:rhodanese-like domain protein [Verrucomicrobiae bacterium DG1235]
MERNRELPKGSKSQAALLAQASSNSISILGWMKWPKKMRSEFNHLQYMRNLAIAIASLLLTCLANAETEQANASRFAKLIEAEDTLLIDFRTPNEIAQGKIPNALEIDFFSKELSAKLAELPKDKKLLLYCRSGNRSSKAAKLLDEKGYKDLVNLVGGIGAWQAADLPMEKKPK